MLSVSYGNGGWVCIEATDMPGPVYLRLALADKRWTLREIYSDGAGGEIDGEAWRQVHWDRVIASVIADPRNEQTLKARLKLAAPDLSMLAAHYNATFGSQARHWVAASFRAQQPGSKDRPRRPEREPIEDRMPTFAYVNGAPLTDEFLRQVVALYRYFAGRGRAPAPAIAAHAGVSAATARKWVYLARERGIAPPGQRGKVGL